MSQVSSATYNYLIIVHAYAAPIKILNVDCLSNLLYDLYH